MAIEEIAAGDMDSVLHTNRGGLVLVVVCGWMSLLFLVSFLGNLGPGSSTGADVAAAAAPSAMTPPTECSMPSDMMVSGNNCSYNDEQSMEAAGSFSLTLKTSPQHKIFALASIR